MSRGVYIQRIVCLEWVDRWFSVRISYCPFSTEIAIHNCLKLQLQGIRHPCWLSQTHALTCLVSQTHINRNKNKKLSLSSQNRVYGVAGFEKHVESWKVDCETLPQLTLPAYSQLSHTAAEQAWDASVWVKTLVRQGGQVLTVIAAEQTPISAAQQHHLGFASALLPQSS